MPFLQNAENSPPPAPELLTPSDESRLGELTPSLRQDRDRPRWHELRYLLLLFPAQWRIGDAGAMRDGGWPQSSPDAPFERVCNPFFGEAVAVG